MVTKYFDKWLFEQVISLSKTNPIKAELKFEEYIKEYPNDYSIYAYYASNLITLGKFDKAEKVLKYVENIHTKDKKYAKLHDKVNKIQYDILISRLRLLCYQEKYDEAYKICLNELHETEDFNNIIFFCKYKNGEIDLKKRKQYSYFCRQVINYEEIDFLFHIQNHLYEYNENLEVSNESFFSPKFPIDKVIEEVKKYIPSDKKIYSGFLENVYIFKYDGCGRDNNKLVDYFKVVCFHNTSNIITICPSQGYENFPQVDLNYLIQDNESNRKNSSIEKFNRKYRNK